MSLPAQKMRCRGDVSQNLREKKMADREGFEPSVTLLLHTLSKRAHSTTLTSVLIHRVAGRGVRTKNTRLAIIFGKKIRS